MIVPVLDAEHLRRVCDKVVTQREKCLYLYCNLMKYGVGNPDFKVYTHEETDSVFACYYGDSLHILAPGGSCARTLGFVDKIQPRTIFSSERLDLKDRYREEFTGLYRLTAPQGGRAPQIQQLGREDIAMLVDFLYSNSQTYQWTYDRGNLQLQLLDRLDTGYCRYFGVFSGDELVGCTFTKAELNDMMIVGGVLVAPTMRKQGLGSRLCTFLGDLAVREGKQAYCFIDDDNLPSVQLHTSVGYSKVETVYKYVINNT